MKSKHSTPAFLSSLPAWIRFLDGYSAPSVLADEQLLRDLRWRCRNVRRRLRDGPLAPLRIAFFGPTGAGKSKLFSSLIGKVVSRSGFRRPFTRQSCYYLHDEWRSLAAALEGHVELHTDASWREVVLVDTPDFDSVELANREEAERVFLEADGFLFVTDALKYADASTWEYLQRIHQASKKFAVLLNKVNSETIADSFHARYRQTFALPPNDSLPFSTIAIPEFPIRDDVLIDPQQPAIRRLHETAMSLAGKRPADESVARFRGELEGMFEHCDELLTEVRLRRQQVAELTQRLDTRFHEAVDRLEHRLSEGLEPAVRSEVYQRVMKRLDSIDVLRYPRKILALPIQGIRSLLGRWTHKPPSTEEASPDAVIADPLASETFHMLESELIRFADESRLDVIQQPGLKHLMTRECYKALRLDHAEIQSLFRQHHEQFRDWVESHARDTAAEITGENKFKFILSQVLFHTVLITAQIKTGGGLTLLEAGFDGVVSPFVAKAVSVAIGNEKVKQFESQAHQQHQRSLAEILAVGRGRFASFFIQSSQGLEELEQQLDQMLTCRSQLDSLVAQFRSGALTVEPPSSMEVDPDE